jgi:hypothetical protein
MAEVVPLDLLLCGAEQFGLEHGPLLGREETGSWDYSSHKHIRKSDRISHAMTRKTIFISCGQYTAAEKALGTKIAEMVRKLTDLEPFFAEEVQDLNGLDANILGALHNSVAFITVLHPRGEIKRPDGSVLIRASIWIEQEIAIATYIHRVENRSLPIIAFKHTSVGREGIRDLLHLNPIEFTDEAEILAELPKRLESWKSLKPSAVQPFSIAQRESIERKLKELDIPARDLLRFLLQRGESDREAIQRASKVNDDARQAAIENLTSKGLILKRDDTSYLPAHIISYFRVNPQSEQILQEMLYPRNESRSVPDFIP